MDDLISRQAAIEICEIAISLWDGQFGTGALTSVKKNIQNLPSAEPEIEMWLVRVYDHIVTMMMQDDMTIVRLPAED